MLVAGILLIVGIVLLRAYRRSVKSGVAHIPFQWPNEFERTGQPLQFWLSVSLAAFGGYFLILASLLCFVDAVIRLIARITA
jgi:hypothetical protein